MIFFGQIKQNNSWPKQPVLHVVRTRATRRLVPYKCRQIGRNSLAIIYTEKSSGARHWHTAKYSYSPSSDLNSHSSHLNGRLLQCVSLCLARELLGVQQYSHYSHLYGRSPPRGTVSIRISTRTRYTCMGFAAVRRARFKHFFAFVTSAWALTTAEEGLDSILWPSKSRLKSRSTIFAMTPLDGKCQNLQTSFITFLFSQRYDLCSRL